MKRILAAVAVCAVLGFGFAAVAGVVKGHPNLEAASKALHNAEEKMGAAQKANEYDMGGHAAKAKDLISQALTEIDAAAKAAK